MTIGQLTDNLRLHFTNNSFVWTDTLAPEQSNRVYFILYVRVHDKEGFIIDTIHLEAERTQGGNFNIMGLRYNGYNDSISEYVINLLNLEKIKNSVKSIDNCN